MTREEFDGLIQRYEKIAREHPRLHIAQAVGLMVLAFGYLLLVLFGSLALSVLMLGMIVGGAAPVGIFGLAIFAGLFVTVLRGLWVRLNPPTGRAVTRAQAPRLFALLDELRATLDCQPFHHVLVVNDLNAAVVQIPRLGIFGWHRNYLVLGLPLLASLSPEEFRSVLAHEFAHSSRGHGRFGNWLYRVRRTWAQVVEQMVRRRTRWGWVLTKFLDWFWPKFNGHTFVLARTNEYVADACSVRLAGAETTGRALVRTQLDAALLEQKFWPEIFARAKGSDRPPADVMTELQQALREGPTEEDGARWLRQAFLQETSNADTHPSLKDRLRAIGRPASELEVPIRPAPVGENAAEHFLGEQAAVVARQLSEEWQAAIKEQWQARHQQALKLAEDLATLDTSGAPPGVAQLWDRVLKLVNLHGDDAAVPVLEQLLALEPQHAGASFILGRQRLKKEDPLGVDFIETALRIDPQLTEEGCGLLYTYFNRTGQRDRLRPLEHRVDRFRELVVLARKERATVTAKDPLIPHALTPEQIAALRKLLATEKDIASAAVACKRVQHFPDDPCRAIAVKLAVPWWMPRSTTANRKLVQRLVNAMPLPGHFIVFAAERHLKALSKNVYSAPGAVIYERQK